jgi:NIMA (never in mitosis gene a)-related kinase 1/4/5
MSRTLCGTPYFWPPEVCMKFPYNSKADIWAMGVIVYELLFFRKPFNGNDIKELE